MKCFEFPSGLSWEAKYSKRILLSALCVWVAVRTWHQREKMATRCWTLCLLKRTRRTTETPLKWKWVRLCCPATPTTVGSWVLDSCWNGWTPQPVCLVGQDLKKMKTDDHVLLYNRRTQHSKISPCSTPNMGRFFYIKLVVLFTGPCDPKSSWW